MPTRRDWHEVQTILSKDMSANVWYNAHQVKRTARQIRLESSRAGPASPCPATSPLSPSSPPPSIAAIAVLISSSSALMPPSDAEELGGYSNTGALEVQSVRVHVQALIRLTVCITHRLRCSGHVWCWTRGPRDMYTRSICSDCRISLREYSHRTAPTGVGFWVKAVTCIGSDLGDIQE